MALNLAEIILLCLMLDWGLRRCRMPGLIGMLGVGVLLGPHVFDWLDESLLTIGPELRMIALIVILLRAGFALNRKVFHRVGGRVLLLAFVPATIEALTITIIAPMFLPLTPLASAVLGSVLAAVSPAVVVPAMLRFNEQRRGTDKDIPAMIMAAASVDDVYVIVWHGIVMGLYLGAQSGVGIKLFSIPLSLLLGVAVGLLVGWGLYRHFERFNPRATKRALVVIAVSIILVRAQYLLGEWLPFAGLVAAMSIGFMILEKHEEMAHEIASKLAKTWVFAEIVLFAMVGAEVDVSVAWHAGVAGVSVIVIGLIARFAGVFACLVGSSFNLGERFFVAVAFTPKATVQAAIGAAPLLAMQQAGMNTAPGELILAMAVMSIVLTAPLGAWAIDGVGKRVLTRDDRDR